MYHVPLPPFPLSQALFGLTCDDARVALHAKGKLGLLALGIADGFGLWNTNTFLLIL
jgi:hypothetical protein